MAAGLERGVLRAAHAVTAVHQLQPIRLRPLSGLILVGFVFLGAALVAAGEDGTGLPAAGPGPADRGPEGAGRHPEPALADSGGSGGGVPDLAAPAVRADSAGVSAPGGMVPGQGNPALRPPFGVGESLKFSVQYGPIKAGTAVLSVEGIEKVGNEECYRLVSTAQSHVIFSPIYKVRDRVVSFVDVRCLLTRRTHKALREKDYQVDQSVEWDHERGKLIYHDGTTLDLMPGARDVLGAFYYVRTLPLEVGETIPVPAHDNKKSYPIVIKVVAEETIDTPLGRFDCIVVEPMLETDGLFRRSGSLRVWMTRDEERLPVMMQSAVKVGAITAILVEIRRGERREPAYGLNAN